MEPPILRHSAPEATDLESADGQTSTLPPKLGPGELQFMTQPLTWNSSQRPEAVLCQIALRRDGSLVSRATVSTWGIRVGTVELILHKV